MRKLTEDDAEWCWLIAHEEAVVRIQRMISTAPVLAHCDVTKPVTTQCDACQTGIRAAFLQDDHPIAYSSPALTATKRNYAQIGKEFLAIIYASETFDQHIFGKSDVVVESDDKTLETIFRNRFTAHRSGYNGCDYDYKATISESNTRKEPRCI